MMTQDLLCHAYTDAPEPHPNLFLGSLQLLFWLFCRPSAWRHHIARIDPTLRPDFCLAELQRAQWQHPAMRRLLVQGYVVLLALSGALVALVLMAYNVSDMAEGMALGVVLGAKGVEVGVALGAVSGALYSGVIILPYALGERIAGPWAGIVAGILGHIGLSSLVLASAISSPSVWLIVPLITVSALCGLTHTLWRPIVFYPFLMAWHTLIYRADERRAGDRPSLLRWHAAFWDEHQRLPWFGLDEHVVLVAERCPQEAQAALDYLSTSRQRWAAQAAQIELDARQLERCTDVTALSTSYRSLNAGELEGPASATLRSFSRISQDINAALQQESSYNQRLALSAVEERLDGLLRESTRSSERYAVRFHPVAIRWRQLIAHHVQHLRREAELRQEIDNPYIVGVPLTAQQELFVGRTDISARIEHLLLDRRRPPVLLYGPRRMGKTSLLNNLGRLLPSTIVPLFVDLQGPASLASDHTGLLYNLARDMANSAQRHRNLLLPPLARDLLETDPFTGFDEWLDEVERVVGSDTILLALDEFEVLDKALTEERFSETMVLGMLRHLIQHRPRFKVLLAGSHTLDEVQRWASYLINVQVVHLHYLNEDEARQLIEHPIKDFPLHYEPAASERALALTRGHPALVQLLCSEIVALKNEQPPDVRRLARLADVEAAIPEALNHGQLFFADITHNQVDAAGLALLRFVAAQGEGAVVDRATLARQCSAALEVTLALLTRRELIEAVDGGYRLQVELIRRWFAQEDIPGVRNP
jgi:hypothetical protein